MVIHSEFYFSFCLFKIVGKPESSDHFSKTVICYKRKEYTSMS